MGRKLLGPHRHQGRLLVVAQVAHAGVVLREEPDPLHGVVLGLPVPHRHAVDGLEQRQIAVDRGGCPARVGFAFLCQAHLPILDIFWRDVVQQAVPKSAVMRTALRRSSACDRLLTCA
jgi:hypothetical protein